MELRQLISSLWRWKWLILGSVLIASVASFFASQAVTPLYRAKTTLLVGQALSNPDPNSTELKTGQDLARTYAELAGRRPVLETALISTGLDINPASLSKNVSTNIIPQTVLIEISVISSSPSNAQTLANAIAQELIRQSPSATNAAGQEQEDFIRQQLSNLQQKIRNNQDDILILESQLDSGASNEENEAVETQIDLLEKKVSDWQNTYAQLLVSLRDDDTNALKVFEEASLPNRPFSPNILMNVVIAAALGLIFSTGGALIIDYLDDTIKDSQDITQIAGVATLGSIPPFGGSDYPKKLVTQHQPLSPAAETFRALRTNLRFASLDKPVKTILVTSPIPVDGKSVTVANLATTFAQSGQRTVIIDADLRRPVQHQIFNIPNTRGLTDAILTLGPNHDGSNQTDDQQASDVLNQYLQTTQIENLRVLTTGKLPPNPAELLGSERMEKLIQLLKEQADIILFDSPPTLAVTDATILSSLLDGTLLILNAGRSRAKDLIQARENLEHVHANLLGVVLNKDKRKKVGYQYYYSKEGHPQKAPQDG